MVVVGGWGWWRLAVVVGEVGSGGHIIGRVAFDLK